MQMPSRIARLKLNTFFLHFLIFTGGMILIKLAAHALFRARVDWLFVFLWGLLMAAGFTWWLPFARSSIRKTR